MFYYNSSRNAFNLTSWLSLIQQYIESTTEVVAILDTHQEYSYVLEIFNDKQTAVLFIEWLLDKISKAGGASYIAVTYEDFRIFLSEQK